VDSLSLRDISGPAFIRWFLIVLIALPVILFDQWTKRLIEANVPLNSGFAPFPALEQYFNIVHYTNTGAAFGILQGQKSLFLVMPVIVIAVVLFYARTLPPGHWAIRICLGCQIGGAAGNLIDRIRNDGQVTDFLLFMLPVGNRVYQWPAFNVADSSLVVATILLVLLLLRMDMKRAELESTR